MKRSRLPLSEVCSLLGVTRQTMHTYQVKYKLKTFREGRSVFFDAREVIEKLYLPKQIPLQEVSFSVSDEFRVEAIEVAPSVFDLRLIRGLDPFGVMCLLCCLIGRMRQGDLVMLIIGHDSTTIRLKGMNFFHELVRFDSRLVQFDQEMLDVIIPDASEIIMPLQVIGYRGGERAIMDELSIKLKHQGFSTELCASLGWMLGELADNTSVHAGGVPCYFILSSMVGRGPSKFLTLTIGDTGLGIPQTLRANDKYKAIGEEQAFACAFKSDVTSRGDEYRRGRGLNDLLGVAKGNASWVRAESNGLGLMFDFQKQGQVIQRVEAGTITPGTRFCLVLIDSTFGHVSRREIDQLITQYLEKV